MPPTEIETSVAARDVDDMRRLWAREPWGAFRDNLHSAQICSILANVNRGKNPKPFTYRDFMILDSETQKQTKRAAVVDFFRAIAKPQKRSDDDGDD